MTILAFSCACPAVASGQDRVVLLLKGGKSRIAVTGIITDYTGTQITIRPRAGMAPKTYPASQVLEVQTSQSESHARGLELLADYRIESAALNFEKAIDLEPRKWVRRELLALVIQCETRLKDLAGAGLHFRLLVESDPTTKHFKLIPLLWIGENLNQESQNQATGWLLGNNDVYKLIGASWLLTNGKYGDLAANSLRELSKSSDQRVRQLARAQLWRQQLRGNDISLLELNRWQSRIEAMPEGLRGGPYYILGNGHLLRQEYDQAAAAFLWTALVFDFDHRLASRSCLQAADSMKKLGQLSEARNLYREVAVRFRDTSFAQDASQELAKLTK